MGATKHTKEQKLLIIHEALHSGENDKKTAAKYNISSNLLCIWKQNFGFVNITKRLENRKKPLYIRSSITLRGNLKNEFINDCIKRGKNESKVGANAIAVYYSIIKLFPELEGKEFSDVKAFIMERIRV